MKTVIYSLSAAVLAAALLSGCGAPMNNAQTGAIAGSVVGGVIGHQFGRGEGNDVATATGAIAGGIIGSQMGAAQDAYATQPQTYYRPY